MINDAEVPAAERQNRFGLSTPPENLVWLEARAVLEAGALVPTAPWLLLQPRGDGRQIMVLPGFKTDDQSTWPLRKFLQYLGYEAHGWGLGTNTGNPEKDAERLAERLDDIQRPGEPITLIGWSLGGVVARATAMNQPDRVREIITMGTPVEGGPKYTRAHRHYSGSRNIDLDQFEAHIHSKNQQSIDAPITVIYSRSDGIVGWQAAIDRYNANTRHIRVHGSHLGLGFNPCVWNIIAKTLKESAE